MAEDDAVAGEEVVVGETEGTAVIDSAKKTEDTETVTGINQCCNVCGSLATCLDWIARQFTSCCGLSETPCSCWVTRDEAGKYGGKFEAGKNDVSPKETDNTSLPTASISQQPLLNGIYNIRFTDKSVNN